MNARTPEQIIGKDALIQLIFEGYVVVPMDQSEADEPTCPHGQPLHQDCFKCSEADKSVLDGIRDALESRGYVHMANGRDIGKLLDQLEATEKHAATRSGRGGPTVSDPDRPYCKDDQSCCDFTCGN